MTKTSMIQKLDKIIETGKITKKDIMEFEHFNPLCLNSNYSYELFATKKTLDKALHIAAMFRLHMFKQNISNVKNIVGVIQSMPKCDLFFER